MAIEDILQDVQDTVQRLDTNVGNLLAEATGKVEIIKLAAQSAAASIVDINAARDAVLPPLAQINTQYQDIVAKAAVITNQVTAAQVAVTRTQSLQVDAQTAATNASNSLAAALVSGNVQATSAAALKSLALNAMAWVQPNTEDGFDSYTQIKKTATTSYTTIGTVASATVLAMVQSYAQVNDALASDAFNIYVDSILGNDTSTGASRIRALATLDAATAATAPTTAPKYAVARGSMFAGGTLTATAAAAKIASYGSGAKPLGDGRAACPAFTLTNGETLVYQTTISFPRAVVDTSYKGNIIAGGKALKQVTSVALCRTTPGSCYVVDWSAVSTTVYVHTATDVAPGADNLVYEYTKWPWSYRTQGTDSVVYGLSAQWPAHQGGGIRFEGEWGIMQSCDLANGNRHCAFMAANAMAIDCTFTDGYNDLEAGQAADGLVVYSDVVTGKFAYTVRCKFKAVNSTRFSGFQAHGQIQTELFGKQYHFDAIFEGPLVSTVTMSAVDSRLLNATYRGVIGGASISKVGVVGLLSAGRGTINQLIAFNAAAAATCTGHVVSVPSLTTGFYYSALTTGDISLTINGDQITILDGKALPSIVNADFMTIARGTVGGTGMVVKPAIACPLNNAMYVGFSGGTVADNLDYVVWPRGARFLVNGVNYPTLAAYQAATGKQPNSTTAALPTAVGSDNFNRTDENLDVSTGWSLLGGTANQFAVRSNQLATIGSAACMMVRAALTSPDHWARVVAASTTAGPFLAVRAVDLNNFIGLRWGPTYVQLYKYVSGTGTLVASITRTVTVGDVFIIAVRGANTWVYHNDEAILGGGFIKSITDDILLSGTLVGFRNTGSPVNPAFDDFSYGLC